MRCLCPSVSFSKERIEDIPNKCASEIFRAAIVCEVTRDLSSSLPFPHN